jgi:hypothetical protein
MWSRVIKWPAICGGVSDSFPAFLPSLLESPDEWIDSDWNKEGRKSGMDIATKTRPLVYDPCSISSLSGLNLNFYEEVIPSLIALGRTGGAYTRENEDGSTTDPTDYHR